jgi:hypothetical protein
MARYVVNRNAQSNGDHEVHVQGCRYFPSNYTELGDHSACRTAVAEAKRYYPTANGCATCSSACHTS